MPSDSRNSTMAKATGLIFSLFNVASAWEVPFAMPLYIQCILNGFTRATHSSLLTTKGIDFVVGTWWKLSTTGSTLLVNLGLKIMDEKLKSSNIICIRSRNKTTIEALIAISTIWHSFQYKELNDSDCLLIKSFCVILVYLSSLSSDVKGLSLAKGKGVFLWTPLDLLLYFISIIIIIVFAKKVNKQVH